MKNGIRRHKGCQRQQREPRISSFEAGGGVKGKSGQKQKFGKNGKRHSVRTQETEEVAMKVGLGVESNFFSTKLMKFWNSSQKIESEKNPKKLRNRAKNEADRFALPQGVGNGASRRVGSHRKINITHLGRGRQSSRKLKFSNKFKHLGGLSSRRAPNRMREAYQAPQKMKSVLKKHKKVQNQLEGNLSNFGNQT